MKRLSQQGKGGTIQSEDGTIPLRGLGVHFKAGTGFVDSNIRFSEFAHFTIQSHFRSSVVVKLRVEVNIK